MIYKDDKGVVGCWILIGCGIITSLNADISLFVSGIESYPNLMLGNLSGLILINLGYLYRISFLLTRAEARKSKEDES